jgi:hypothetical protein
MVIECTFRLRLTDNNSTSRHRPAKPAEHTIEFKVPGNHRILLRKFMPPTVLQELPMAKTSAVVMLIVGDDTVTSPWFTSTIMRSNGWHHSLCIGVPQWRCFSNISRDAAPSRRIDAKLMRLLTLKMFPYSLKKRKSPWFFLLWIVMGCIDDWSCKEPWWRVVVLKQEETKLYVWR